MSQADDLMRAEIGDRANEIAILKEQLSTAKQTVKDIREKLHAVELRARRDELMLKILNGEKLRDVQLRNGKTDDAVDTGEDVVTDEQEAIAA